MTFYSETVYRPPSEAHSLILRLTRGCSHNECTFCTMYKDRPFEVRDLTDILKEIEQIKRSGLQPQRIFLADGNALCIKTQTLVTLLTSLKMAFPTCERITSYAAPLDVICKSKEELIELQKNGLDMVYMGLESGSERLLKNVQKGVTPAEMIQAGQLLHSAGIKMSITVISGLGGTAHWQEHAVETARVLNQIQPQYLGLLTLMLEPPGQLYQDWQSGTFTTLSSIEVLQETQLLLENLDLVDCVFRSNHASNYFSLRGNLPQDKIRLLAELEIAIASGPERLKAERYRGL